MSSQSFCKTAVLIPIKEQNQNIDRILDGLLAQTVKPSVILFVIDRGDKIVIERDGLNIHVINVNPVHTNIIREENQDYFAGTVRNMGILWLNEYGIDFDVLILLDGDCIPESNLIETYIRLCNRPIPVMAAGRRREEKYNWKDRREVEFNFINRGFFETDLLIDDPKLLYGGHVVWTCNMALNRIALTQIQKFNQMYYDHGGLFSPLCDGGWGAEDTVLCYTAYVCNVHVVLSKSADVKHIDHPAYPFNYAIHLKFVNKMVNDINTKIRTSPLTLDFFTF